VILPLLPLIGTPFPLKELIHPWRIIHTRLVRDLDRLFILVRDFHHSLLSFEAFQGTVVLVELQEFFDVLVDLLVLIITHFIIQKFKCNSIDLHHLN
jgi:hypothetical protein